MFEINSIRHLIFKVCSHVTKSSPSPKLFYFGRIEFRAKWVCHPFRLKFCPGVNTQLLPCSPFILRLHNGLNFGSANKLSVEMLKV